MQAKNNITITLNQINSLTDQSLDSFPHKPNEEDLKSTQKASGIELIKKASDENLEDEPKRSKLEINEEIEEFNYLNEDNFPSPSEDGNEDNSFSSEKTVKFADFIEDIRQNDEQRDQSFLSRKTDRKKSDDYSYVGKNKKISLKKVSD